jgi:predicted nuclease of predicted toxin-antitoxin system
MRWLSDHNFNHDILRGLVRRCPKIDFVTTQDEGLETVSDPELLEWAASEHRVVLTHDRETMHGFANERIRAGLTLPGVVIVSDRITLRQAIDELELIETCMRDGELTDCVLFVPIS